MTQIVFLGDSLTRFYDDVANRRSGSIATYSSIRSGQQIAYYEDAQNAGVGGNKSADMLARFDTDVAPQEPAFVHLLCGTNDSNDAFAVPLGTYSANVEALVAEIRAIGATPVLGTVPPTDSTGGRRLLIGQYNRWLRDYCAAEGIVLVDYYTLLVDPTDGTMLDAYRSGADGTHPNHAGMALMGGLLADSLSDHLPPAAPLLVTHELEAGNVFGNLGMFTRGLNSSSVPLGWSLVGSTYPSGVTASLESDADIKGQWLKLTSTGHTGAVILTKKITSGGFGLTGAIVPGNRYRISGRIDTDLTAGSVQITAYWNDRTTAPDAMRPVDSLTERIEDGVFTLDATAPSDATHLTMGIRFDAGAGVVKVAQLGVFDLTALGI